MLKNYKSNQMKIKSYLYLLALVVVSVGACKEGSRFDSSSDDATPTGPPTNIKWKALNGGARFYYTIPADENLLSVDAEYTNSKGNPVNFTASYFVDSLDVLGLGDTNPKMIKLFGVNRAGVRSAPAEVEIIPLEPAVKRVAETLEVKPAFSAFFIDWENELKQMINVYVHFKYTDRGELRDVLTVFSSNQLKERRWIKNLNLDASMPIEVSLRVEDRYENTTKEISYGSINLLEDFELDKSKMVIPVANDSTIILRDGTKFNTKVPAMFGDHVEGRMAKLINGVIDRWENLDFFHTGGRGRTGQTMAGGIVGQNDWNIILDLGGYYRLSRIVTHQRHSGNRENTNRGQFYRDENCGQFRLYVFNEQIMRWDTISHHKTPIPPAVNELDWVKYGEAGDMALFYPDDPQYTIPARWFRYEKISGFESNYSSTNVNCMSELTVYGIKE